MNGFYIPGRGFVPLESRSDVFKPEIQSVLRECHGRREIGCGCRRGESPPLILEVIKQPDGVHRLDRHSIADLHGPDCVFVVDCDFERCPPSPDLIFDVSGLRETSTRAFRHVVRRFLSAVHTDVFWRQCKSKGSQNAGISKFFDLLNVRFDTSHEYPFYSVSRESEKYNLRVVFGFLRPASDLMILGADIPLIYEEYRGLSKMGAVARAVTPEVWRDAIQAVRIFRGHAGGPYLFSCLLDRSGNIRKLVLFPIYVDASHILLVDSGSERRRAAQLIAAGMVPYKPVRLDDFRMLVERIAEYTGKTQPLPKFRSDFYYQNLIGKFDHEEVKGFEDNSVYDSDFEHKSVENSRNEIVPVVTNAWELPAMPAVSCPYRAGVLDVEVDLGCLSLIDDSLWKAGILDASVSSS